MFATNKYHQYIYGKHTMVESDHKPLEAIFSKKLCEVPKRLQRMRMQLQAYNLTITYKKGKEMHVADALSRNFKVGSEASATECEADIADVNHLDYIATNATFLNKVASETIKDPVLQ